MKKNRLLIILSSIIAIYAILGFVAVPNIVKPQIEKILNENLNEKTSLEKVSFNPFLLKFSLENFKIYNEKQTIISLKKLLVDFSIIKSLDEKHISFKNLHIKNLFVHLIESKNGVINLETLVKEQTSKKEKSTTKEKKSNIKFQIYKTFLDNAQIKFTKEFENQESFNLDISNLNYTFYDMGTFQNTLASHSFKALINKKTKLKIDGGLRLSPFEMNGNIKLENLKPTDYLVYKKDLFNFYLDEKAYLNLNFGYKINTKEDLKLQINNANFNLHNLDLKQTNKSIFAFKDLVIDDIDLFYPQNKLSIEKVTLNALLSKFQRNKQGVINYSTLINIPKSKNKKQNVQKKNTEQNPWNVTLDEFILSKSNIQFNDLQNRFSTKLEDLNINLLNLQKTEKLSIETISLKNKALNFKHKKDVNINIAKLNFKNSNLNLIDEKISLEKTTLNLPNIKIDDYKNKLNLRTTNLSLVANKTSLLNHQIDIKSLNIKKKDFLLKDLKAKKEIKAKKLSFNIDNIQHANNNTKISKVELKHPYVSIKDKKNNTDILAKNIIFDIRKTLYAKNSLKIASSNINKPFISIILGKQTKKEESKKAIIKKKAKTSKKSDFEFDIGPVKIKDMAMKFEDKNLPIPFKTDITQLKGEFSRLHSSSSKPTKLQLEGKVDKYGYTKIAGTIDINDIKLLTDTNLLFKNIAIKNFTPYSGKFIGREIEGGKLNLDLKYNIKSSNLKAQNSVIISDIKLGEKVKSPDAVNLPLELAIALLEDSNGVIDIELPVTGNVDDPQFSIAPIVWKVFTNLIVKAISAPFTLLASVFGIDEEELKSLDFEFGKSNILASEKESLDNIAKILTKKPKLAIVVKPTYDPINDKIAIQDIKFDKYLESKMKKVKKGDEYKITLEKLYSKEKSLKPLEELKKEFINKKDKKFDNISYVEYLRKTLASKQKVSKKELEVLANNRLKSILQYLIKEKKILKEAVKIDKITKQTDKKLKWSVFNLDITTR